MPAIRNSGISNSVLNGHLPISGMNKVNTKMLKEEEWASPKWKFGSADREISFALGRLPESTDLNQVIL